MVGTGLAGRYELKERLATGGMGAVYEATDTRLERRVAVKILKEGLAEDPRFVERFRREARAAGALSHPNIAGVFDYGEDEGRHFIVMELVPGRDLARLLREEGPLSEERAVRIAAQIADAIGHAHAAGVVHRDIKPANVIVGPDDRVKVTDFGIARAQTDSSLTATGSFMGTAQYISPEQAAGTTIGPPSDIYSLGIVTFEMVTGSVPYTGDSAVAVAMRHISDDVPTPSSLKPELSSAIDSLVRTATAREPGRRFRDAAAFAAAARSVVTGAETARVSTSATTTPIAAPTATAVMSSRTAEARTAPEEWPFPAHPPRWDPRNIGRAVVTIFVILLLVAAALFLYRLAQSDTPERRGGKRDRQAAPAEQPSEEAAATFELPDVTDRDYEDARAQLEELGLATTREDSPNEDYPEGVVFDTDPAPGSEVEEGDTITLYVSTGPAEEEGEGEGVIPEDLESTFTPPGQEKKKDKDGDG